MQGGRPNDNKSYTEAYQTHEDCGYGYKVVCCYKDKYSNQFKHIGVKMPFTNSWKYEIYLKVKKFIQTIDCDENDIIPRLINGVGIIPAYVPLIIESDDMEPTEYYSLSAAARGSGLLKQTIVYAYRNR